jgi:hypothetical protein
MGFAIAKRNTGCTSARAEPFKSHEKMDSRHHGRGAKAVASAALMFDVNKKMVYCVFGR